MQIVQLNTVKVGDLIKRSSTTQTVYIRGNYCRENKKYSLIDYNNVNREIFLRGNTRVIVGFTF